jgi:hypothetical protein
VSDIPLQAATDLAEFSSARFNRKEKYLAVIGASLSFGGFWLAGKVFRIPIETHFSASLLEQPTVVTSLLITVIVFAASVAVGCLIAGVIGFDAGAFCATAGACAFSARGGPMRYTLFEHPTAGVWVILILELALLAAIIYGGVRLQHLFHWLGLLHLDDHRHVVIEVHESIDQKILALVINVVVMGVLMILFAATDRKVQVLGAVVVCSFLGTLSAYQVVPTKPSIWYWSAPFIVGAIGYGLQYVGNGGGWQIGEIRGPFAGLARPLPLDYAGAGVAASIVGYWISRRWQHEREISTVAGNAGE